MAQELSRRERLRAETFAEITELAMAQVAEGGPAALSLNAIAKQMRMSGPAIYRYFASRDELLKQLVVDAYGDLAETLGQALQQARRRRPDARFRAVAGAYRAWALDHPGRYPLLLGGGLARGDQPPEIAIASQRAMQHMLVALRDLAADRPAPARKLPRELDAQLRGWAHDRGAGDDLPPWLLRLAIVAWQRLHGHIALELEGVHAAMGISSDALYRTEVDAIIAEAIEADERRPRAAT
jgi:AcrR family transcriptional regulator